MEAAGQGVSAALEGTPAQLALLIFLPPAHGWLNQVSRYMQPWFIHVLEVRIEAWPRFCGRFVLSSFFADLTYNRLVGYILGSLSHGSQLFFFFFTMWLRS